MTTNPLTTPSGPGAPVTARTPGTPNKSGCQAAAPGMKYMTSKEFRYRIYQAFGHMPAECTVHRWLHEARIYAVRVGHLWLIPESTWEEFLKNANDGMQF